MARLNYELIDDRLDKKKPSQVKLRLWYPPCHILANINSETTEVKVTGNLGSRAVPYGACFQKYFCPLINFNSLARPPKSRHPTVIRIILPLWIRWGGARWQLRVNSTSIESVVINVVPIIYDPRTTAAALVIGNDADDENADSRAIQCIVVISSNACMVVSHINKAPLSQKSHVHIWRWLQAPCHKLCHSNSS